MSVDPWTTQMHPPASYSPWWWSVVALCLLGIAAMLWWARRSLRRVAPPADPIDRVRREAWVRLDQVGQAHASGGLDAAAAASRISAEVRRFVGIVTNGDADYRVLAEIRRAATRDPRLAPVVEVVAEAEQTAFTPALGAADIAALLERAREVVRRWS